MLAFQVPVGQRLECFGKQLPASPPLQKRVISGRFEFFATWLSSCVSCQVALKKLLSKTFTHPANGSSARTRIGILQSALAGLGQSCANFQLGAKASHFCHVDHSAASACCLSRICCSMGSFVASTGSAGGLFWGPVSEQSTERSTFGAI